MWCAEIADGGVRVAVVCRGMQYSLLKSRFSRGQGIDGPGHAVGEAGHEVEAHCGVVGVVPLVARFSGVGFEVVEFAAARAVCADEFVAIGAYHGGMGGRIFMTWHGVVIFTVDVVAGAGRGVSRLLVVVGGCVLAWRDGGRGRPIRGWWARGQ